MKMVKFKITGPVAIKDFIPGQKFSLKCDDKGIPVDAYWRARMQDEKDYKLGHLKEIDDEPPAPAPVVPDQPATAVQKPAKPTPKEPAK